MKQIKTTEAIGHVLCHDMTQIIPGSFKGVIFKKGHVVTQEDIPILLSIGKENLYVWDKADGILHEDEAAEILRDLCINEYMIASKPSEGKIEILADCDGLLKINSKLLKKVNRFGQMMIATRHGNTVVKKGDKLAGTRIIPLVIEEDKMKKVQEICKEERILQILPFKLKKAAIITTGSEVFHHRIEDKFSPVIKQKLEEFGVTVVAHEILDDKPEEIMKAILSAVNDKHVDLVLCTGGMSVDPDDRTPLAIKNTGANIISYGAPVLPGAMFLLAYLGEVPIIGLPGCVMYAKRTIFDIELPRIVAGERITAEELAALGEGGLCLNCTECTFPNCGFGK